MTPANHNPGPASSGFAHPGLETLHNASQHELDALLRHTAEVDRLELIALHGEDAYTPLDAPQPINLADHAQRQGSLMAPTRWWWSFGAAAAAITLAVFVSRSVSPTNFTGGGRVARSGNPQAPLDPVIVHTPTNAAPAIRLASAEADLSSLAHLDPDTLDGVPSLSAERSMLLAVYRGARGECDCVAWRLTDDRRLDQASLAVLEQAVADPCRSDAAGVTVFNVSGPRYMLPFHDEDARKLASCLSASPEECDPLPATNADDNTSDESDSCRYAAVTCLPEGLSVSSKTLRFASR